jgi:hypothetical protein
MKTVEVSTITVNSGEATTKERAVAGEALMEATHHTDGASRDLLCALMSLCRFPEPDWVNYYRWDEAVEYVMTVETGYPEFLELQQFVKQQQVVLDGLYDRITQLADSHKLPLEWVNGHP